MSTALHPLVPNLTTRLAGAAGSSTAEPLTLPLRLAAPRFAPDALQAVTQVLATGMLVQGTQVAAFEAAIAEILNIPHAVACSSGTAALQLALLALDLKPGDEVIVPDLTFPATVNMVLATGGIPRVVDVSTATGNVIPEAVEAAIGPRTRAILPVHLFGLCAELQPLLALGQKHGLPVLEDAACALGATWPAAQGESLPIGRGTWAACLSFHPRKILTTGEGGMVVTEDGALATRLRHLRNHGASPLAGRMDFHEVGFNLRLTELQGALGVSQARELPRHLQARQALAAVYHQALYPLVDRFDLTLPVEPLGFHHVWQSYVVLLPRGLDRDRVAEALKARQVESTLGSYALHAIPCFQERLGLRAEDFPGASRHATSSLALPIHTLVTPAGVAYVAQMLEDVLTLETARAGAS